MGQQAIDEYSFLHLATGMIFRYFEIRFGVAVAVHVVFEVVENSPMGVRFINEYLKDIWPGGKPRADSVINSIYDTVFFVLGWVLADLVIQQYRK